MNIYNLNSILSAVVICTAILFSSCRKEKGCTDPKATNYKSSAEQDDGSCVYPTTNNYTIPTTYEFNNADGKSTVSYSGQKQRLEMLSEMTTYMKSGNTKGTSLDKQKLLDMYANSGYSWTDGDQLGMTGSSKQLKSKTALADAGIQSVFEKYIENIATISTSSVDGVDGTAGVYQSTTNAAKKYLQDANGREYTQLIEKGLMGAVFASQMIQNYLKDLDSDDNSNAVDAANGKYYTEMEHHWDEAYGYFTSEIDYPTSGTDRFWGKYANKREGVLESATSIVEAFRKGRAAISNKDYATRNAQKDIIVKEMIKTSGGTAIYYFKSAKSNILDAALRNHALSEGYAFVDNLRYMNVDAAKVDAILTSISADYKDITVDNLNTAIDKVVEAVPELGQYKDQL